MVTSFSCNAGKSRSASRTKSMVIARPVKLAWRSRFSAPSGFHALYVRGVGNGDKNATSLYGRRISFSSAFSSGSPRGFQFWRFRSYCQPPTKAGLETILNAVDLFRIAIRRQMICGAFQQALRYWKTLHGIVLCGEIEYQYDQQCRQRSGSV